MTEVKEAARKASNQTEKPPLQEAFWRKGRRDRLVHVLN